MSLFSHDFDCFSSLRCLSFADYFCNLAATVPYAPPRLSLNLYTAFLRRFFSATVGASISTIFLLKMLSNLSRSKSSVPQALICLRLGASSSSSWKSVLRILYLKRPIQDGLLTTPTFSYSNRSLFYFYTLTTSAFMFFLVSCSSQRINVSMMSNWWSFFFCLRICSCSLL